MNQQGQISPRTTPSRIVIPPAGYVNIFKNSDDGLYYGKKEDNTIELIAGSSTGLNIIGTIARTGLNNYQITPNNGTAPYTYQWTISQDGIGSQSFVGATNTNSVVTDGGGTLGIPTMLKVSITDTNGNVGEVYYNAVSVD